MVEGLEISGLANNQYYQLPSTFTQKEMPVSADNIISEEKLAKWSHLKDAHIPCIDANVDLLIGTNASKVMEPASWLGD